MTGNRSKCSLWQACGAALFLAFAGAAEAITVDANTNVDETVVGRPLVYRIIIEGATGAEVPMAIDIDGLTIRNSGSSQQVQIVNFDLQATTTYTYTVMPRREGEFTIPPQEVIVQGKRFRTPAVPIKVHPRGTSVPRQAPPATSRVPLQPFQQATPPPQPGIRVPTPPPSALSTPRPRPQPTPRLSNPDPSGENRPMFAELQLPKDEIFVGEIIPVVIRFYFSSYIPVEPRGMPQFGGDDFTAERLPEPDVERETINGRPYQVATFRTAIVPVKAGELEIPPATLTVLTQPQPDQMIDDFFDRFLRGRGGNLRNFGVPQEVEVASNSATLTVKPLPVDGQPDDFTGAVGSFTLESSVSPERAQGGDPVTLTARISGRGNFNAMEAPLLRDDEGWRSYPPKETFDADDEIGFRGVKSFEYLLVAEQDQKLTPAVGFSYFDPSKEEYVRLTAPPLAVDVQGATAPTPTPAAAAPATAAATPTPEGESPGPTIFPALSHRGASFLATASSPAFLWVNAAGAVAFVTLLGFLSWKKVTSGERGRCMQLKRSASRRLTAMGRQDISQDDFYHEAIRFLQEEAGRSGSGIPDNPELSDILSVRVVDETLASDVRRVFSRSEEVRYSPTSERQRPIESNERDEILNTLKRYQNANFVR